MICVFTKQLSALVGFEKNSLPREHINKKEIIENIKKVKILREDFFFGKGGIIQNNDHYKGEGSTYKKLVS